MSERLFESPEFWEGILPDDVRRTGVRNFVDSVIGSVGRIETIILIRYELDNERLALIFNPPNPPLDEDPSEFTRPLYLHGKNTLRAPEQLVMTKHEMDRINDAIYHCFRGWEVEKLPYPFSFSESDYQERVDGSEALKAAEKYIIWERPSETSAN